MFAKRKEGRDERLLSLVALPTTSISVFLDPKMLPVYMKNKR